MHVAAVESTEETPMASDAQRVYNLYVDLIDLKAKKKASNAAFSEEIKTIEKEIYDIVEGDEEDNE